MRARCGIEKLEQRLHLFAHAALLKDIYPGMASSRPESLVKLGNSVYFFADNGIYARELWKSNGTADGTGLVRDIAPGSASSQTNSFTHILTNCDGTLYFAADDGIHGVELWKSDGTAAGTMMVTDLNLGSGGSYPNSIVSYNGLVYFSAFTPDTGRELWRTEGTEAGTVLVKDIAPGATSSNPAWLTNINGTLYFSADGGGTGAELWKSDGTAGGTVVVKDIISGATGSSPANFASVGSRVFFTITSSTGSIVLYTTDGTASGTVSLKTMYLSSVFPKVPTLTPFNGKLYFPVQDTTHGRELWITDGTPAGTMILSDSNPGTANGLFEGVEMLSLSGSLYFFGANSSTSGMQLFRSDGTANGTIALKKIRSQLDDQATDSIPGGLANVDDEVFYFSARDDSRDVQLYESDGTPEGTSLVEDINPATVTSSPTNFVNLNGQLLFTAGIGTAGTELWTVPDEIPPKVRAGSFDYDAPAQSVSLRFSEDVSPNLAAGDLVLNNLSTGDQVPAENLTVTYDPARNIASFTFPGYASDILPDGSYRATLPAGSVTDFSGNALTADFTFEFFSLKGDANHDATVDTIDFNILATNFGQSGKKFSEGDFNYDGSVDTTDFNLLAANFSKTLAAPSAASASSTPAAARPDLAPAPRPASFSSTQIRDLGLPTDALDNESSPFL